MRSVCFYSSYYAGGEMAYYVKFYLKELKKHFSELVFLTNEKVILPADMKFLQENNIQYRLYKNEGFDFGMWYKAFQEFDVTGYDRIGLINDSSILFSNLDNFFNWADKEPSDYCGVIDCNLHSYHVQSYFIIINKRAILPVKDYFEKNGLITDIHQVIKIYEIGLSTYMINCGMNVKAYFSFKDTNTVGNPSWMQAKNLIKKGFPLVKKRIIARNYGETDYRYLVAAGFDPYPSHYIKLLKKATDNNEIDAIFRGIPTKMNFVAELEFGFMCFAAKMYGIMIRKYRKAKYGKA